MKEFCSLNGFKNLINGPTCYKNSEEPTCIDLILKNQPILFQHSNVLDTGFSDFHFLTVTEFKSHIIGTTKTMTMISLDLKFKAFVL